ncbi:anti-phage dCTP deaminase [Stigmatella aurantiaca]|nr:anti-phage dCTP deaminase [Stigmatella aurantiaca]
MSAKSVVPITAKKASERPASGAQELLKRQASNELFFAVVGHVGSGTSTVAKKLEEILRDEELSGGAFDVVLLKARSEITEWARRRGKKVESLERDNLEHAKWLQNWGDEMREEHGDHTAVATSLIGKIKETRALKQGLPVTDAPVPPDGARRAYILDALRHPAEAHLLRSLYRNAFALIGVVCDEEVRCQRLISKFRNAGRQDAQRFMKRDEKAEEKHGQKVSDTFHLADYFLDNSEEQFLSDGRTSNKDWDIPGQLSRLVKIITHSDVVRPETKEMAMHAAYGAQMGSACLSRQVGAALTDAAGNIVSTGANEVPRAGGGVYGQGFSESGGDERCAYRKPSKGKKPGCSNTQEQNEIIQQLLTDIEQHTRLQDEQREILKRAVAVLAEVEHQPFEGNEVPEKIGEARTVLESIEKQTKLSNAQQDSLRKALKKSRIGSLLEFSRAVHAEMDVLLSAARQGASTQGCRLFVTTFPCHYCARHIVGAGVDEVQFIEPYPKSRALDLHDDSITTVAKNWIPPSAPVRKDSEKESAVRKVLFRPFTGVAPRMYARAFLKDRDLKDSATGEMMMGEPEWETAWNISKGSHAELEAKLLQNAEVSRG